MARRGFRIWLVVMVAVVATVVVVVARGPSKSPEHPVAVPAPLSVVQSATHVPQSVLDTIGEGSATNRVLPVENAPFLSQDGLPLVVYVGSEFCPYCAAQRWALVIALSRFGRFSKLSVAQSATSDVYPRLSSFSFFDSTYTSSYLRFDPVEQYSNTAGPDGAFLPLEPLGRQVHALVARFDREPYAGRSSAPPGTFPFVDIANRFLQIGSGFPPGALVGQGLTAISQALSVPSSPIAQAVDGAANGLVAAICSVDGHRPRWVCTSSAAAEGRMLIGN
ncbi:MAG: DUF929 domain-containing protein [Actinobacteria bacterium]|jgi:hypothetical protein|nr:DUF929 domain-containing protein [Actinomycetota bacterium]